ncbi:MAG: metallophosphoesterase [Bryobacteraceae bacterium]|nr:MAG: metallophosphoesterase [Bryobacteraceae bacterium]
MRRLIVSDIHANLEALEAVLRDAEGRYDEILCCGDVVGYNANPAETVEWARRHVRHIVRGNHDRVVAFIEQPSDFNYHALEAARWTHARLSREQLAWLRALPAGPLVFDDFELVHGSPRDEDEYVLDQYEVLTLHDLIASRVCFFGHTHVQGGWMWTRGGLVAFRRPRFGEEEVIHELADDGLFLLNPGSVGQPRDGDPRAAYAIWDTDQRIITFRRVEYDIAQAQQKILDSGLPERLALRLAFGR